ncbi:MAG: putative bifunctional diguanylate cyclase/phosphodiesterase [Candidatus Rokuibacteriota bacterium]
MLWFLILMTVVQVSAFMAVDAVIKRNARAAIKDELVTGGRVFQRLIDARNQRLAEAARVLSSDFALKEVVSTRDHDTLLSAMENHRARIGADMMMLVSLENRLIVDTLHPEARDKPFAFPRLIAAADEAGEASAIVAVDGLPYQLVVVPLLAPVPIAWVSMGFVVDVTLAEDLQKLTSAHVSFLQKPPGHRWMPVASTLPLPLQQSLLDALPERLGADGIGSLELAGTEYETFLIPLPASPDPTIHAALQRPLEEAMRPYQRLRIGLFALFLGGAGVSLLGGAWIARSVSRPVRLLAEGAHLIEKGDYGHRVKVDQRDELGQLATTFNNMTRGIAEREAQITYQAHHDTLTELPNRTLLQHHLQRAIGAARQARSRLALLLMDLDRFKEVNDTLGHPMGDLVLQEVGPRLRKVVREPDVVARLGGDEFAVLLPTVTDVQFAIEVGRRIVKALEAPFWLEGLPLEVGASIGIALYPDHGEDGDALIQRADVAMYLAKRSTSGWALYSRELDQHSARRLTLVGELRQAIESGQLALYGQPKMELATGRIKDVEILVNWHHPQHGLVFPDEFIPLAEQTGLIRPLTVWVLEGALRACKLWRQAGLDLSVGVNLSVRILLDRQFPDRIARLLDTWAVDPRALTLEVTESAIMTDPACAKDVLTRLDAMGLRLAVDDFGTGYSSLTYLKELPVDEVKIDKSFVMNMSRDPSDAVIVRSTIELAHNLGFKVTAEGVETQDAWTMLKSLGCDLVQGYLISRPLPIADLPRRLAELEGGGSSGSDGRLGTPESAPGAGRAASPP